MTEPVPFKVRVPEGTLRDLRRRIRNTRWPAPAPGQPWAQGTDLEYLRSLLAYWADGFDWRAQEQVLNVWPQYTLEIHGVKVHFVHRRAGRPGAIPIILTHGWPSAFIELLDLAALLVEAPSEPAGMPVFDVVIPALPGYPFSSRPSRPFNYRDVARLWQALMATLGYERYAVAGGDFGAGVSTLLALDAPEKVLGLLLWTVELEPPISAPASLTDAEREYLANMQAWRQVESGYKAIQSTRPQTLGYGLNDSPAGLAAWVLEKWRAWSGCAGNLDGYFSRDLLLTLLTIYWVSSSITTSLRDYFDNRWFPSELRLGDRVEVPTAFCLFPHQTAAEPVPPRSWLERLYNIERWTIAAHGGHFAPVEDPGRLAAEIRAHFR